MNKKCTICKIEKEETLFFNKCSKAKSGYREICKKCQAIKHAEYYSKNKDKKRKYFLDNFDRIKKRNQESITVKISQKVYGRKNRNRLTEYMNGYREKNRERYNKYMRGIQVVTRYGITLQDKLNIIERQENKCAICGIYLRTIKDRLVCIDHDHDTGKVRGVLCHNCNTGLGNFKDNIQSLKNAIEYLSKQ